MAKQIIDISNPLLLMSQILEFSNQLESLEKFNGLNFEVLNNISSSEKLAINIKETIIILGNETFITLIKELNDKYLLIKNSDDREKELFNLIENYKSYHFLKVTELKDEINNIEQIKSIVPENVWKSVLESWNG